MQHWLLGMDAIVQMTISSQSKHGFKSLNHLRNLSEMCLVKINFGGKFGWKNRICFTLIEDPQISNQIDATVCRPIAHLSH